MKVKNGQRVIYFSTVAFVKNWAENMEAKSGNYTGRSFGMCVLRVDSIKSSLLMELFNEN